MSPRTATVTVALSFVALAGDPRGSAAQPPPSPKPSKTAIRAGTALSALVTEADSRAFMLGAATGGGAPEPRSNLPRWLLAHYRRNHPEMLAAAAGPADPTGGFPLALESLYVWMLRHQDLQPSPVGAAVVPTKAIAVGGNVRASGQNTSPRSESDIRVNPANPLQVIGASNNIAGNGRQAQFFSNDGGATWKQAFLPLLAGDSLQSDPTVDWTSDGAAWATTIGISAGSTSLQMRAYTSTDGGKTWAFDGTFSGDQTNADKQMMWVDHSPTSPHRDNIYVIWHNGRPGFVGRRTSAGWQPPVRITAGETTGTAIGSDVTTNGAGDVFAVWPDTGSRHLFFASSQDGGATFSTPVPITTTFGSFQIAVPADAQRAALIGVSIAAFRDGSRNDVYVSWIDLSGTPGCNVPSDDPLGNTVSPCTSRLWFTRSADGGAHWEAPRKINDGASLSDQFNHRLVVDPATGTLGVVYYDTAADVGRNKTHLVFQASADGGLKWSSPPTTVSSAPTDETSVNADNGNQYGDYNGLTVAGQVFMPYWTDRRDVGSEAIFTARITVTSDAAGNLVVSMKK